LATSSCNVKQPIDEIVDCRFRLVSELIEEFDELEDEFEGRFFSSYNNGVALVMSSFTVPKDAITYMKKIKKKN
jgi:hypothetical protein